MRPALGQPADQERIHGPGSELAALGSIAQASPLLEDLADLRSAEVGVDREARPGSDEWLVARRAEDTAERRRDAALPDDRVGDRAPGPSIPHHGGLALV